MARLIADKYREWEAECEERFNQLKANEEELTEYSSKYGLQDELNPEVEDRDVTVRKANLQREIKSLISYAVGCMFGRYSVDVEGLCFAGGEWDPSKYKTIIPDEDNIIPICDDDYFEDDIVGKFIDFVRKVYGEETLEQNLAFIADALGGKGTSREVIRNYFLNSFYADHCSTYSVSGSGKRPIYWLFSSGKKNGFKALIYMHRYKPDLLARMRTDYVHEQQERYRTQIQMLEDSIQSASTSDRVRINKTVSKLKDQSVEIQKYEEKIHHLADQMIPIDLDDGVKVNYAKFQDVLERIKIPGEQIIMNKTAIKNYAIWARVQLIESCKQKAFEYGITEDGENKANLGTIGSRILTDSEIEQRNQLISQINQKGYAQVMEEVAYTWFNRFIALRYMEINGYLPSKIRVLSAEDGSFKPEILKEAMTIDLEGVDRGAVADFIEKQDNEGLYKYLLIAQCNALNKGLPYMFEKLSNWTELLFPANILRNESVLGQLVDSIPEEDWTDQVQIIGWLYQYYNSELKDETFALLKKNIKITKERIPAATQLFTPDWIVRYMVENSLGKLWYEGHSDFDKSQWKYYLDEAEQEPEVEEQLTEIRGKYADIKPEEIKVIDPCMGSGHILVYAFDILMQIYTSAGWSERDAAKSIVDKNLYGLDIDDRAGQLAYFAVMMKARKHSRRILNGDVKPNVISIQESNWMTDDFISYIAAGDKQLEADLNVVKKTFVDAKEYGSILNVSALDYERIASRIEEVSESLSENIFQLQYKDELDKLQALLGQAKMLSMDYDIVITNPPYMGSSGMSAHLTEYVKKNYPDSKSDLFAVFIERCGQLTKQNGLEAMITQHGWMFLTSFEKLRNKILNDSIVNMAHLGARAFEEIAGEVVQTTSFVKRNTRIPRYIGTYCRLLTADTQNGKEELFLSKSTIYNITQNSFLNVPGCPITYWVSEVVMNSFSFDYTVGDYCVGKVGLQTGDNNRYLRLWQEIDINSISFCNEKNYKWYPYNKGGSFRRWYGNIDYVLDWENDGRRIKNQKGSFPRNTQYYFKEGITWSDVATGKISMRVMNSGTAFDTCAPCLFSNSTEKALLAFFNTKVAQIYMDLLSPTLHYTCGTVLNVPFITPESKVDAIVEENVSLSKDDWDSFENSCDFKKHPLI